MNTAYHYTAVNSFSPINSCASSHRNVDSNNRFEIHTLEWIESQFPEWSAEAGKLRHFEVLWIKKGSGVLWVDEQNYQLEDNTVLCLAPGHVRKCNFEIGVRKAIIFPLPPEFIWLSEESPNNPSWLEQYNKEFNVAITRVNEETQYELEVVVRKMKWEFSNYLNRRLELIKGLLNIFLIYFSRNLKEPVNEILQNREAELVRKFMGLLKKNYIQQKMVCDYATQLCVTPNYLNRTVKKITGFTASHHIQQQIILEAKRKAIFSSVTMKEIAYTLGFDNLAHFSKFFKNNCGMSFTDYKKTALQPG